LLEVPNGTAKTKAQSTTQEVENQTMGSKRQGRKERAEMPLFMKKGGKETQGKEKSKSSKKKGAF